MWKFAVITALFLVVGSWNNAIAAGTDEAGKGFAGTYGFILSQESSLERITQQYPELAAAAKRAKLRFDVKFGNVKSKLEARLPSLLGQELYKKLAGALQKEMVNQSKEKIDLEAAQQFIADVETRATGDIPSPYLEYLLAARYLDKPTKEFTDGWTTKFKTAHNEKSAGVDLIMEVPKSWKAEDDSDRPHILQTWVSRNYKVTEMIALEIEDAEFTDAEVKAYLKSGAYKKTSDKGLKNLKSSLFTIEGKPGYSQEVAGKSERAGSRFYHHGIFNHFYVDGKMVTISCIVIDAENEKAIIDESFTRIKPLCHQILNSVVLP